MQLGENLTSKMDANKKVEVNEVFIAECLKHKCLWDVKARAYKDRNAREFEINLHTQGFTQTVLHFLFCLALFLFETISVVIATAVPHSSCFQFQTATCKAALMNNER